MYGEWNTHPFVNTLSTHTYITVTLGLTCSLCMQGRSISLPHANIWLKHTQIMLLFCSIWPNRTKTKTPNAGDSPLIWSAMRTSIKLTNEQIDFFFITNAGSASPSIIWESLMASGALQLATLLGRRNNTNPKQGRWRLILKPSRETILTLKHRQLLIS